jgi:hypothetical protein
MAFSVFIKFVFNVKAGVQIPYRLLIQHEARCPSFAY